MSPVYEAIPPWGRESRVLSESAAWFVFLAALSAAAWVTGKRAGSHPGAVARLTILTGVILLVGWAYLMRNPSVAVRLLPVSLLSRVEGTGAVPLFMLIVGVAWSQGKLRSQRRVAGWAAVLGVIYFIQGGMWMLQTTPAVGFAQTNSDATLQSQDYSCVAAAAASALNHMGIRTTEAEMAELTETRPGTGSTLIRAANGIDRRLMGTGYHAEILQPDYEQLRQLPLPALTPLQFDSTRRHMVTLLQVRPNTVRIHDPESGRMWMTREMFLKHYRGQVIVIVPWE